MSRFQTLVVLFSAALVLGLGASVSAAWRQQAKEKPKDAPTFDDKTAALTETKDGKEKKTQIELKYCLKVKGFFDADGFNLEEVDEDGPASKLGTEPGGTGVRCEKGDIIKEVDGKAVKTAEDYAKAMNGAADHDKVKIKVKDINGGQEVEFYADTAKR
jgi:hypothetical protein